MEGIGLSNITSRVPYHHFGISKKCSKSRKSTHAAIMRKLYYKLYSQIKGSSIEIFAMGLSKFLIVYLPITPYKITLTKQARFNRVGTKVKKAFALKLRGQQNNKHK